MVLQQVQLMIGEIEMRTQSSRRATAAGIGNLTVAEAAVERARESLKAAQRYLETEGSDALQRAIQRSEKFGQQSERMSQIARDARQAADQLDEAAVLIESTAQEALNTSSNAYQLAREAVDQQKNTTEEIDGLRRELTITEQTLARTQAMAKEALTNAQSAYTEALSLLGDAYSLVVPNVEWQFMKRQAAQHSEEARRIKAEADQLTSENSNMLDEVSDQIIGAGDVLAKGVAQQQIADELLADADVALGRSQEAVSLGDKTLQEAQKTLETLEGIFIGWYIRKQNTLNGIVWLISIGFDSLVQESKEKARDALGQVGEIKNLIEQAEERTREAQNALAGAESDARVARDSANQAQEHAEQASKVYLFILDHSPQYWEILEVNFW